MPQRVTDEPRRKTSPTQAGGPEEHARPRARAPARISAAAGADAEDAALAAYAARDRRLRRGPGLEQRLGRLFLGAAGAPLRAALRQAEDRRAFDRGLQAAGAVSGKHRFARDLGTRLSRYRNDGPRWRDWHLRLPGRNRRRRRLAVCGPAILPPRLPRGEGDARRARRNARAL